MQFAVGSCQCAFSKSSPRATAKAKAYAVGEDLGEALNRI
jgi:hypothetical protein